MTKVIKLIQTEKGEGLGKEGDPVRNINQLWTLDGKLIAEYDHFDEKRQWFNPEFINIK